jgi:hypothetical protein
LPDRELSKPVNQEGKMSQQVYTKGENTNCFRFRPAGDVWLLTQAEAESDSTLTSLGIDVLIIAASGVNTPPNAKWIFAPVDDSLVPDYRIKSAVAPLAEFWRSHTIALTDAVSGQREAAFLLACAVAEDTDVSFATAWAEVEAKLVFYEGYSSRVTDAMITQGTRVYPSE